MMEIMTIIGIVHPYVEHPKADVGIINYVPSCFLMMYKL